MKRPVALLTVLVVAALSLAAGTAPARAAVLDGTCVASITLNFSPPATQPLPPEPRTRDDLDRHRHDHHLRVPGRRSNDRHVQLHPHRQPDLPLGTERDGHSGHHLV